MRVQLFMVAGLLTSCVASVPAYYPQSPSPDLAGRVAGAPQRCVPVMPGSTLRPAAGDPNALVYQIGNTLWVSRLSPGCNMDPTLVLQPQRFGPSYCQNDLIRSTQPSGGVPGPTCTLTQWVPYTRP